MHIVVAGGGMAGLSTALALGRSGHRVTVMERDDVNPAADFGDAFQHERRGIPHFHQPHAFLPRGRQELISLFPDVYSDLLNAGAADYAVNDKIRGQRQPEDGDLVYLSVRRPIIEWALRKALVSAGNVKVLARTRVAELIVEGNSVPAV